MHKITLQVPIDSVFKGAIQLSQEMKLQKLKKDIEIDMKEGNYISSKDSNEVMDFLND